MLHERAMRQPPTQKELDDYRNSLPPGNRSPVQWADTEEENSQDEDEYFYQESQDQEED